MTFRTSPVDCRLVEEQDRGPQRQRAGDRHALLLAAGYLLGVGQCPVAEADAPQQRHGALDRLALLNSSV
jgi:hypothetical protein